jgi:hypothetical protein
VGGEAPVTPVSSLDSSSLDLSYKPCDKGLSIHPVGSSAPWRFKLIISPCVPIKYGTCLSGMILHINRYALHGLISHRDHSNVNHIQSSIISNMCIKPFLPSQVLKDIIQICKASLEEVSGHPLEKGCFRKRSNPSHVNG